MASFKDPCCFEHLATLDEPQTGDETTCPGDGKTFLWDGLHWRHPLDLGQAKVRKIRNIGARVRRINQYYGL